MSSLKWCKKCKRRCIEKGKININCLACKWQYVGQDVFERKEDLFEDDIDNVTNETPYEYWKGYEHELNGAIWI